MSISTSAKFKLFSSRVATRQRAAKEGSSAGEKGVEATAKLDSLSRSVNQPEGLESDHDARKKSKTHVEVEVEESTKEMCHCGELFVWHIHH
jgi:hypothetical protein